MFSTHATQILADAIRRWEATDIYIANSHDGELERLAHRMGKHVHSAGITLYQTVLCNWLAGYAPLRTSLADGLRAFDWYHENLWHTPLAQAATIHTLKSFAHLLDKKDIHYKRLVNGYLADFSRLHEQNQRSLGADGTLLQSYEPCDSPEEWLKGIPPHACVIFNAFDPDPKHQAMEAYLGWHTPQMTPQRLAAIGEQILTKRAFIVITPTLIPTLSGYLRGMAVGDSGKSVYFYSNDMIPRLSLPKYVYGENSYEVILDRPIDELSLRPISGADLNKLRAQYLADNTPVGWRTQGIVNAVAVTSGDYLLGVFGIAQRVPNYMHYRNLGIPTPVVYLTTDFVVSPTIYPRLGKLILAATLTIEARAWMEQSLGTSLCSIVTTAFSEHPVSMKYRGIYKQIRRLEQNTGFMLIYYGMFRDWHLADALGWWQKLHGGMADGEEILDKENA